VMTIGIPFYDQPINGFTSVVNQYPFNQILITIIVQKEQMWYLESLLQPSSDCSQSRVNLKDRERIRTMKTKEL